LRYRPLGRAVTIALWRANNKPPVELVVANLETRKCATKMRNVAHFFFSYNGIFGIEEVILQNIWQNTQEKIRNIKRERENRKR